MNNGNEVILFPNRLGLIVSLVISICFVASGIWLVSISLGWLPIIGWISIFFFGLCVVIFTILLMPKSAYLQLNREGFTICSLFRVHSYRWSDIKKFGVTHIGTKDMVAFNFSEHYQGLEKLRSVSTTLSGYEGVLPDTYGMSPDVLAATLNDFRSQYMSGYQLDKARISSEAISNRHPRIDIPPIGTPSDIQSSTISLKIIPKTKDTYVDDCFQVDFQEFEERGDWRDIPEAKAIPGKINEGKLDEALSLTQILQSKYPDFYYTYTSFARIYTKQGRFEDARISLLEGLQLAKSKHNICSVMGDIEWELGNLLEAVKWWIKSIYVQVGYQNQPDNFGPFLYLSYVAEQLDLHKTSSHLRLYVDRIRPGQIRMNAEGANKIYATTKRQGSSSMKRAIELLDKECLS